MGGVGYLPLYLDSLGWSKAAQDGATALFFAASLVFSLPFALDDPAGRYHVQVTDVLTGASAEAMLRLE